MKKQFLRRALPKLPGVALCLVAGVLTFLVSGCLKLSNAELQPVAATATAMADRQDCDKMLGTAFRSKAERSWWEQNCSRWPLVNVPQGDPVTAAAEPQECAQMRGKPYDSEDQRQWYLRSCNAAALANAQLPPPLPPNVDPLNAPPAPPPADAVQVQSTDRTNCKEISGTPYRSDSERGWFTQNCQAQVIDYIPGPDRFNCAEIGGTPYRSQTERAWFAQNCQGRPIVITPQQQPQPQIIIIQGGNNGTPNSNSNQRNQRSNNDEGRRSDR